MKKFLSILLSFSFILSLSLYSCQTKPNSDNNNDNKEPERDIEAENQAIREDAIFLLNDETYDPNNFVVKFLGDFYISGLKNTNLSSETYITYPTVYKTDDFLVHHKQDFQTVYQTVLNNMVYIIHKPSNGGKAYLADSTPYNKKSPINIFDVFDIDISSFYYVIKNPNIKVPTATHENISVSEDQKSVLFSNEYLKEIVYYSCLTLVNDRSELNDFLNKMTAKGGYLVDEQRAEVLVEGYLKSLGDVEISMTYIFDGKKPVSITSSLSSTVTTNSTPVKTVMKQEYTDMTYQNDELVSMNIAVSNDVAAEKTENGVKVEYTSSYVEKYFFELDNSIPKTITADIKYEETMTYLGKVETATATSSLSIKDNALALTTTVDNVVKDKIVATEVYFTVPDSITIPEDVYSALPKKS